MSEKTVVVALGHRALGTTLPEQKTAARLAAKAIADLVEEGTRVVISHSNGPQVGMIHTAMNEFGKAHPDYTFAPMSVCSAMSQGYIGYDLQNAIRAELISRGIYKPVSTILTQVVIDPYDEAFSEPEKIIGRVLNAEEAEAEEEKGNFVTKVGEGQYRRILAEELTESKEKETTSGTASASSKNEGKSIPELVGSKVTDTWTHMKLFTRILSLFALAGVLYLLLWTGARRSFRKIKSRNPLLQQ